ncbi:MAG: hypothetical protein ACRDJS_04120 [Actinomycetota bacterium]
MNRTRSIVARLVAALVGLLLLGSCSGAGINAGGESPSDNGGVAFIAFTVMLVVTGIVLWLILGRED